MKTDNMIYNHEYIVDRLRRLPRKMLLLHGLDNVTEFVLHELTSKDCFDVKKAAYFIDNPDFNCLKGVVGVSHHEPHAIDDIWATPDHFTKHMNESLFNQQVRACTYKSNKKHNESYDSIASSIATDLGFENYKLYSWDMKHDNAGVLVCEKNHDIMDDPLFNDVLVDSLALLGFCPVH